MNKMSYFLILPTNGTLTTALYPAKRAISVKTVLSKEFDVDASLLFTDGKGAAEPVDSNTTPTGKSENRRVEFIKI